MRSILSTRNPPHYPKEKYPIAWGNALTLRHICWSHIEISACQIYNRLSDLRSTVWKPMTIALSLMDQQGFRLDNTSVTIQLMRSILRKRKSSLCPKGINPTAWGNAPGTNSKTPHALKAQNHSPSSPRVAVHCSMVLCQRSVISAISNGYRIFQTR